MQFFKKTINATLATLLLAMAFIACGLSITEGLGLAALFAVGAAVAGRKGLNGGAFAEYVSGLGDGTSGVTITRLELHNAVKSLQLAMNNMESQLVSIQEAAIEMGGNAHNIEVYYRKRIKGTKDAHVKFSQLLGAMVMGDRQCMVIDTNSGTIFPG